MACTGWGYDQVMETMDLPRLESMREYHQINPPLHLLVARYLGVGEAPAKAKQQMSEEDFAELMSSFPQTPPR